MTTPKNATETNYPYQIQTWLRHIHALAEEIGSHGPTTAGERKGHTYCQATLDQLGYRSHWENFHSARSIFAPHLIASLTMLAAFVIYPLAGRSSSKVNAAHPELDGYPVSVSGGNTEMADALRRGIPAIILFGLTRQNAVSYWHQVGDTVDKMDSQALEKNYTFALLFMQALDETA